MRRIQSGSSPGTNPCRATSSERHSPTQQGPSTNPQSTSDNASIHASVIKEDPNGFLIVDGDAYSRLSDGRSSSSSSRSHRASSPPRDYVGVRLRKWGASERWTGEFRLPNSRERIHVGSFNTKKEAAEAVASKRLELGLPLSRPSEK